MERMVKKLLIAGMLIPFGIAHADDTDLVVQTKSGKSEFALSNLPTIHLNETSIGVKGAKGETAAFEYADIEQLYFKMVVNMIEANLATTFQVNLDETGTTLHLQGIDDFSNVNIFSMNGKIVKKLAHWKGNKIDISSLVPGVYIIQVNNQALKFKK
ncbi:MAG: T9SS type A sorting domain-containing protein [Prevotella sp.]|nr:T9SS type A sorting domain-containing protein [Prevotella sp.]MDY3935279.1 T9SS type A sorting domain-containing protein [Prevotella sp.]MDY4217356.1 T9SS type A sorting domain-containing protein [Prevotella sp.]